MQCHQVIFRSCATGVRLRSPVLVCGLSALERDWPLNAAASRTGILKSDIWFAEFFKFIASN